jgi:Uncharacterised nucleotidyltransferase
MHRHPIGNGMCTPRIPRELAALIAALQLKGATTEALLELDEREWKSLLQFCDIAHLTLPLAQIETNGFPSWVIDRLKGNIADNAARFERVKATFQEAATALKEAGSDYIVLKGFAQTPEYVTDARLRLQSDLDFYCPKEVIHRAETALTRIGYQPEQTTDYSRADHLPTLIRQGEWQWRGNSFDPDMPLSIELHFCLWNEDIYWLSLPEVERFWDRRIIRTLGDMSFPALNPVDHLAYFSLHILRTLLTGDWVIHHVHELASFLHKKAEDDEFWSAWKQTHRGPLRVLQAIAYSHAASWFCCDIHAEVLQACQELDPKIQEWLRRFTGSSLEGMFHQNKAWVWLHSALLNSPEKRRRLLKRALVPSRMPGKGEPTVVFENRQPRRIGRSNPHMRYIAYVVSRLMAHLRLIPVTLFQGLSLWLSQRQLKKQFWIFLAASFLTGAACQSTFSCSIYF